MVTLGIQASAITYNMLIHRLLDEMVRMGYTPDSMAHTSVIEGHCKHQNLAKAFNLLAKMKQRRVKPYVYGNL
ncbi:hypothetical protein AMTRI_Chr12g238900 [Amborella trichopoda]